MRACRSTPEETAIRTARETVKKESQRWRNPSITPDLTENPRLAKIAKTYFQEAKSNPNPEIQAVLFCKAREVAKEVRTVYPTLDPLIIESIFEEALACEKAAQSTNEKFSWILRGAQTITPTPKKIQDNPLDPLHSAKKYTKGSELWETAAKLALLDPIPSNSWFFKLQDSWTSRMDFSVDCFEAAAVCSDRACIKYKLEKDNPASKEENTRRLSLLKSAIATLNVIEVHSGSSAGLKGKIVEILTWQHYFKPEDKERAEKLSKKHLKAADLYAKEALTHEERASQLLLQQVIHIHSAASLASSLEKRSSYWSKLFLWLSISRKNSLTLQAILFSTPIGPIMGRVINCRGYTLMN